MVLHDDGRAPLIPGTTPSPAALPKGCRFAPRCPIAMPACSAAEVALAELPQDRAARCIRVDEAPALIADYLRASA